VSTDIRTASLVDLLAGLVAEDADAVALAQALDPVVQEIATLAEQCAFFSRIADLTEEQADEVAAWFHLTALEGWGSAGLVRKRIVLAEMVDVYRRRGTRWALERLFGILETPTVWDGGGTVWDGGATVWDSRDGMLSIEEWWQAAPVGPPHTYRVDAEILHWGLTLDEIRHLHQVLDAYTPAREELFELSETIPIESQLLCAGYPEVGLLIEVP
jgi:hypothetical protein